MDTEPISKLLRLAFGADVDYAQLIKLYGEVPHPAGRYTLAQTQGTKTFCCTGDPDPQHISASYAERHNLTMWMSMRGFTRITNAFSKKVENHCHALALYFTFYNFARIHKKLRVTPAMAARVSNRPWSMQDIVALIDAAEGEPKKRGPYKPRRLAEISK